MSLHTPSLMSAGRGVTIISPDGSHRIPVELQADYAAIVLLDPEPAMMAQWVWEFETDLGVTDAHRQALEDRRLARSWHILRVTPRQERFVTGALMEVGIAAYYPLHVTKPKHATRKDAKRTRPLIPGYVFARLPDDESTVQALAIRNVIERLQFGGEVVRVPPLEMGALIFIDACFAFDETWEPPKVKGKRYSHAWKPGQRVRIEAGPFSGFVAEVQRGHGRDHMAVLLSVFGRATEIVVEHRQLVKP